VEWGEQQVVWWEELRVEEARMREEDDGLGAVAHVSMLQMGVVMKEESVGVVSWEEHGMEAEVTMATSEEVEGKADQPSDETTPSASHHSTEEEEVEAVVMMTSESIETVGCKSWAPLHSDLHRWWLTTSEGWCGRRGAASLLRRGRVDQGWGRRTGGGLHTLRGHE
jgi:hypothetical protein